MGNAPGTPQQQAPSSGGLDSNVAAALGYIWILAIVWLVMEPYNKDKFIRFHAFQSLAFGVVSMVVYFVLGMIPILGWIVMMFLWIVILAVWLICVFKAFSKDWFKLPVIGDWAMKQAG